MKSYIIKHERAFKTLFEAFFAYIGVNILATDLSSREAIKGLVAGAIASAISVVLNYRRDN